MFSVFKPNKTKHDEMPPNRYDDISDMGVYKKRLVYALLHENPSPLSLSDTLNLGFSSATIPSNKELALLAKTANDFKTSIAQARTIENNKKFLAAIDDTIDRFRGDLAPLLDAAKYKELKKFFCELDDFIATRPVHSIRIWSGEMALHLQQKILIQVAKEDPVFAQSLHCESFSASSNRSTNPQEIETLLSKHRQARRFIYDRHEAASRVFFVEAKNILENLDGNWRAKMEAALHKLGQNIGRPGQHTTSIEFLAQSNHILEGMISSLSTAPHCGKATILGLVRLYEMQFNWQQWCLPEATFYPKEKIEQLKETFRTRKRKGNDPRLDTESEWSFYSSNTPIVFLYPPPFSLLGNLGLRSDIGKLEKRAANFMPQAEPIKLELYHSALGTRPPDCVVDALVDMQKQAQIPSDTPEKEHKGLRSLMDREMIMARIEKSKAAIYCLRKGDTIEAAYLICSDSATLPPLAKALQEIQGLDKDAPLILADLVVQRPGASFLRRSYQLSPYEELHNAMLAFVATEIARIKTATLTGIVRTYPNPNSAIHDHQRLGWKKTGKEFNAPNGQRYAILEMAIENRKLDTLL